MATGDPFWCFEHKVFMCEIPWEEHRAFKSLVEVDMVGDDITGQRPDGYQTGDELPSQSIEFDGINFRIRDSGQRQEFETGSRRDSRAGKGRFDLIPTQPLRELAIHYEQGSVKYGDDNWKKGQPLMRYVDSALRHINALVAGEPTENHAIAAAWNMFAYRWTLNEIEHGRLPMELDDRPLIEPQYDVR